MRATAEALGVSAEKVAGKVAELHEFNPMLGHRGCRLGITFPEITRCRSRAIIEAACDVTKDGVDVHPEIMIPLVGAKKELEIRPRRYAPSPTRSSPSKASRWTTWSAP